MTGGGYDVWRPEFHRLPPSSVCLPRHLSAGASKHRPLAKQPSHREKPHERIDYHFTLSVVPISRMSKIVHVESPQQFTSLLSSSRIVVTDCELLPYMYLVSPINMLTCLQSTQTGADHAKL